MRKKVWIVWSVLCALISPVYGQTQKTQWVDSVFSTLDMYGKIGQIIMLPVDSYSDQQTLEKLAAQIKKYKLGGVVFTRGGPVSQAMATNYIQKQVTVPILIGMDAEDGLGAVLDSTLKFPSHLMLGSIHDDSLLFFLGAETGKQLKKLGVHINFGPTSDLSTPTHEKSGSNPNFYYGENQKRVAAKLVAYQRGVKSENILSVAKRSPDYGLLVKSVQIENQFDPVTTVDSSRVFPLTQLVRAGADGVITTYEPGMSFSEKPKVFATPSAVISGAMPMIYSGGNLKRQLKFNGLVFSFIPTIQLKKKFIADESEVLLLKSGSDVLLFPASTAATVRKLRKAIRKDKFLQKQLDESVKKILSAKFEAGLNKKKNINHENLLAQINTPAITALQLKLFERSVTVVKNDQQILPLHQLDNHSFASVSVGEQKENTFTNYLSKYVPFAHYQLKILTDTAELVKNLRQFNVVVVSVYPTASTLENEYLSLLEKIKQHATIILVNFSSPNKLKLVGELQTVIQAHVDDAQIQRFVPQLIFGAKKADGVLPVSIDENMKQGMGVQTSLLQRMGYSTPEAEGLDAKTMTRIAPIAYEAIDQKAAPGCQVLIARNGKIIYERAFGWQTYENKIPIHDQTIYDLASVTKVMGTLQAVMFLQEKGIIDIYKKASVYLPELLYTNKKDIILKDILTHQSGLAPFLLMWPQTVKGDTLLAHYYSPMKSENYPLQVAPGLFASPVMKDSIWHWILKSEMLPKPARTPYSTRYSDLGFMILHRIVERLINQPMEDFLSQNLYEPLGSGTMGYLPLTKFPPTQIAPTEIDTTYRKTTVLGTVHDERAAMLGGVAGHAGLFGNGPDLIKLGQMLLQKGNYGGHSFYKPETIKLFAHKQFENSTRGLGWAKPGDPNSPSSRYMSPKGFGHTGFTGTCIWVDPEFDLIFIFLSNSRFPNRSGKLNTTNIRSRIQDTIYQSIFNYCQYGDNEPDRKLMEYLRKIN